MKDHDLSRDQWDKEKNRDCDWRYKDHDHDRYIPPHYLVKGKEATSPDSKKYKNKNMLACILMGVEQSDKIMREMKSDFLRHNETVTSHSALIKQLET